MPPKKNPSKKTPAKKTPAKKKAAAKFKTPTQRNEENMQARKNAGPQPVKFVHVIPEQGGVEGFITMVDGRVEVAMTDPFWSRGKNEDHVKYLNAIDVVGCVLNCFNPNHPTVNFDNRNGYPYKALAKICNMDHKDGDEVDHEYMKDWFSNEVVPELVKLGSLDGSEKFDFDGPDAYKVVKHWGPLLNWQDKKKKPLDFFLRQGPCKEDICQENKIWYARQFLQHKKSWLYSIFPRGEVPPAVIREYSLKACHLDSPEADAGNGNASSTNTASNSVTPTNTQD